MTKKIYKTTNPHVVRGGGGIIAECKDAVILSETGRSDRVFFPRESIAMVLFDPSETRAVDPELGEAKYFHLAGKSNVLPDVAWSYEAPEGALSEIAGYVTFDANKVTVEAL